MAATTQRGNVRAALKKHKRLSSQAQASNRHHVSNALEEYIPYLLALDAGLCGKRIADEEVDLALRNELEVEWRSCIATAMPGRDSTLR